MKNLLLLSLLLSMPSLSYSMEHDLEQVSKDYEGWRQLTGSMSLISTDLNQPNLTDQELDALLERAKRENIRARELDRTGYVAGIEKKVKQDLFLKSLAQIRQERKHKDVSNEEFVLLEKQLKLAGIYGFFRDMKIIEMVFGVRSEKREAQERLYVMFSKPLGNNFSYQLNELQESLNNVNEQLKENPKNKTLITQKKLVKNEIKSFSDLKNYDSFYRSSMRRSNFDLFKQCQTAVKTGRE